MANNFLTLVNTSALHATRGHQNLTHESKIPPIASKTHQQPDVTATSLTRTSLSFALPNSLAFFKRITWELTPWTRPSIDPTTATIISSHIPCMTAEAIQFAICLGVAYTDKSYGAKDQRPHLYVVFPHLRHDVANDKRILSSWHDHVVKGAFDEAWISSGLEDVWESTENGKRWFTTKAAPTATHVFERFFESRYPWLHRPQHREWPKWDDPWAYSDPQCPHALTKGLEGGFSDARARVFDEAWSAIRDMLNVYGEPEEMSGPILLAVWKKDVHADEAKFLVKATGKEWDVYADSRFVDHGNFFVHVEQQSHRNDLKDDLPISSQLVWSLDKILERFW